MRNTLGRHARPPQQAAPLTAAEEGAVRLAREAIARCWDSPPDETTTDAMGNFGALEVAARALLRIVDRLTGAAR
jgi:hypothetical protein